MTEPLSVMWKWPMMINNGFSSKSGITLPTLTLLFFSSCLQYLFLYLQGSPTTLLPYRYSIPCFILHYFSPLFTSYTVNPDTLAWCNFWWFWHSLANLQKYPSTEINRFCVVCLLIIWIVKKCITLFICRYFGVSKTTKFTCQIFTWCTVYYFDGATVPLLRDHPENEPCMQSVIKMRLPNCWCRCNVLSVLQR